MNTITINQIGCLVVRGITILLALQVLSGLGMVFNMLTMPAEGGFNKWLMIAPVCVNAGLAAFMWVKAPWLAARMTPDYSSTPAPFTIGNIQIVMLVAVGFLLLAQAIAPFVSTVAHIVSVLMAGDRLRSWDVLASLLLLALALSLIFTPKGLTKIITFARTTGGEK